MSQPSNADAAAVLAGYLGTAADARITRREALAYPHKFVRSQIQIAAFSAGASGRRMTAVEVYDAYGAAPFHEIATEGSWSLIASPGEPAATLCARRDALGLSQAEVADYLDVAPEVVAKAETAGQQSPVRDLERIAQALALDEYQLGRPGAGGDPGFPARLQHATSVAGLSPLTPSDVLALTEAAWVIARHARLLERLALSGDNAAIPPRLDFDLPTDVPDFERGYQLAGQLRQRFSELGNGSVTSLQTFIEDWLMLPVVRAELDSRIAGVALYHQGGAGIVINDTGSNRRMWTRRVTLARALGHILLRGTGGAAGLTIESHTDIEADYTAPGQPGCTARQAGAFALAFLAPPAGIKGIVTRTDDPVKVISLVMMAYGITVLAAVRHVKAVTGRDVPNFPISDVPWSEIVSRDTAAQGQRGIPLSRTGRFARVTLRALQQGLLSRDSALAVLQCNDAALSAFQRLAEARVT